MRILRYIGQAAVTLVLLGALVGSLEAVVIEGTTPSGKFKTVFVTEGGRLPIDLSTAALQHVVVDSGTITAFQGGTWNVGTAVGVAISVNASTCTLTVTGQVNVGAGATQIYPSDPKRKQGVVCNNSQSAILRIGDSGTQIMILNPLSCYSPDVPSTFIGELYGVSTGPSVNTSYIYHAVP